MTALIRREIAIRDVITKRARAMTRLGSEDGQTMLELALALPLVIVAAFLTFSLIMQATETARVSADINQARFALEVGWAGPHGLTSDELNEIIYQQVLNTTGLDPDRLTVSNAYIDPIEVEMTPSSKQRINNSLYTRQVTTVEHATLHFSVKYEFDPPMGTFWLFGKDFDFKPAPLVRNVSKEVMLSRAADLWGGE